MKTLLILIVSISMLGCHAVEVREFEASTRIIVLGTGQDAGVPQAGAFAHPGWDKPELGRYAACLALVTDDAQYLFDCTPDFRQQYRLLYEATGSSDIDGIFLTHAHIGHYAGLMFLGRESMGATRVPVWTMPRMKSYLESNGPWKLLVELGNIELRDLSHDNAVPLADNLFVTPLLVPHRGEFSETVGFIIEGTERSVLYLPDIDSWHDLDAAGILIEDLIAQVDVAYLDATFYTDGELPDVDMSKIPHPFITTSLNRFTKLPASERAKIHFIHLNHSNPAQFEQSIANQTVEACGMSIAERMDITVLN